MSEYVNLVKLSVGSQTVSDLVAWQKNPRAKGEDGCPRHVTRMWPKREKEITNGGSIYWVIKGQIQWSSKTFSLTITLPNAVAGGMFSFVCLVKSKAFGFAITRRSCSCLALRFRLYFFAPGSRTSS